MLVIRLRRIGRKHDPHYRIVVAEHTAPVQGKFIAEVGHYHPKSKEIGLNQDQFLAWVEQGAKPSNTVAKLADRSGVTHEHITVKEYQAKPKQKAQERSAAKTQKSAAPAATPTEEPANEPESESPSQSDSTIETTDSAQEA